MIGDREELVKALEALQGSVETLKAEKVEMQNELNIMNGNKMESIKCDGNSTNNQLEMEMEKGPLAVCEEYNACVVYLVIIVRKSIHNSYAII